MVLNDHYLSGVNGSLDYYFSLNHKYIWILGHQEWKSLKQRNIKRVKTDSIIGRARKMMKGKAKKES